MNANDTAKTASLALGRSPYSKGAERLAADLGAKPTATLVNTRMEVPSPRNGRPAYRWVDGCYVVRPDGTKEFPPVRIREAWSRCASEGWAFKVVSESEYKEQTVTTHTPRPTFYRSRTDSHGQGCVVEDGTGRTVAVVYDADKDADLLAAAHDLLSGCQAAIAYLAEPASKYQENRAEAVRIIRAAIAKAGGCLLNAQHTPELLREGKEAAKRIRELCDMVNRFSIELGRGKKVDADAWAEDFEAALAKATKGGGGA